MTARYRKLADLHTHLYGCIHSVDFWKIGKPFEVIIGP